MQEEWRPIPGYEQWYQISSLGRVKILAYKTVRIKEGERETLYQSEKISDPSVSSTGYRQIELKNRDTGKIRYTRISKIVAQVFKGITSDLYDYKDGDHSNDCADNIVSCAELLDYSQDEWRWVKGFEDYYQVSRSGLIRNVKGVHPTTTVSYDGYLQINLSHLGKNRSTYVHRVVAEAFLDIWDSSLEVNHRDGNKLNNCADNLEMVTHQENMDHYWRSDVFKEQRAEYFKYSKEKMTKLWQNPEFRNKVQSVFDSPEYKKAHSEASKKVYEDPKKRKQASERSKKMWAKEDFHDKQIEAIKHGWSDPEKRKAASERAQGLVWMTAPDGKYRRFHSDEVGEKLKEGYVVGRTGSNIGGTIAVFCAKNGKTYSSMTACEKDLGLNSGDVHHILTGTMIKRLIPVQADLQLSLVKEDNQQ